MKQPRSVTFLYGGIALALLLVIATVALVLVPPSAPSVAEFAPRAEEQIQDAPDVQSSRFGSATCVDGRPCEAPDRASSAGRDAGKPPSMTVKARVRRCVGDPPRQIEDPQSPPCVNHWVGDNGGGTSRGVTRDEISFAIGNSPSNARVSDDEVRILEVLAEFFNARFEFYGRRIRIVRYTGALASGPEVQRRNAVAASETGAFAVSALDVAGRNLAFVREAARLGLVSISEYSVVPESTYTDLHPFAWSYLPAGDVIARHEGEFACKALVGRPARFAGPLLTTSMRRFAVIQVKSPNGESDATPLLDAVRGCGGEIRYERYDNWGAASAADSLMLADLQRSGITTIIVFGHDGGTLVNRFMPEASAKGYQPEWVIAGTPPYDWELNWQRAPADQTQHLFGLTVNNKVLPRSDKPYVWAFHEMGQQTSEERSVNGSADTEAAFYHMLLALASGVQAAGPNLTSATFARGLQSLRFPNPAAAALPYYQATVGFSADHVMVDDVGVFWWSRTAPAYGLRNSDVGGWCYVGRGARWRLGAWPDGEPNLFDTDQRNCR